MELRVGQRRGLLLLAGAPPSIAQVHERRPRRDSGSPVGAIAAHSREEPLDDWLGDLSDDDWSENATETAKRRGATSAYQELLVPEEGGEDPEADRPARSVAAAEAHQAVVARRRLVAGLAVVVVLALAVVTPVLLLRGQGRDSVAPAPAGTSATPTRTETSPSSAPTTPATTPSTTPSSTTPSTRGASTFTLPEGTKLQRGNGDPAVISDLEAITDPEVVIELQKALSSAGYDPGPADGEFGPRTEAAVVAFQQANGLSADGVVGPETASALNGVVAGG
jgi:murein L,D-transpeptidase YcbB/YkuD